MGATTLTTEIEINASPERIWQILTDFESFPQWNPFILHIAGPLTVGSKITATMKPADSKAMTFTPTISKVSPGKQFCWSGMLWRKGIMDAEHSFLIGPANPRDGSVIFVHSEQFSGIFAGLILLLIRRQTLAGFNAMNAALKVRAEAG